MQGSLTFQSVGLSPFPRHWLTLFKGIYHNFYDNRWIIEECKRQELAEKREQILLDRISHLMGKVAQTEDELQEALEHRKITMADIM